MPISVAITFETNAQRRFLMHNDAFVPLSSAGKGTIQVEPNEFDLIMFAIQGAPGNTAKITLKPTPPASLEISSHPIEGKIAAGKVRWGSSRFFRVRP